MTKMRSLRNPFALASLLAGALFIFRLMTPEFATDRPTAEHPAILLCSILAFSGLAWFVLILALRKTNFSGKTALAFFLLLGVGLRLMFFGSTPVYENDYKRYLWDGSVVAAGQNPYQYSPKEVFDAGKAGARSVPDLARLAIRSNNADFIASKINSPNVTTIYPPVAQAVFTAAFWIAPYEKWGLQLMFLIVELLGFAALLAGLRARALPVVWSAAYWLNPIIIITTYNGIHMDVLLLAPMMAAILWVGRHPLRAAVMLSTAASIKLWPILLAPVLFRGWRHRPVLYVGIAVLVGGLTLTSLMPMLLSLKTDAGLAAYSANWTNSSFLFPGLRDALNLLVETPDRLARYVIAAILTAMSFWFGFMKPQDNSTMPAHLMLVSAAFVFLSPTGYPWYFIWFWMFLPFALNHWSVRGLALLTIGAVFYFIRFQIGEAGHYGIYARFLLPLEFGVPLLVLAWDGLKAKRHG